MDSINSYIKLNYDRPKSDEYVPLNEWISKDVVSNLETKNYVSYLFNETWQCTFKQATLIVQEFLDSSHFNNIENMKLVDDSVKYLRKINKLISEKYNNKVDLVIVTSRQSRIEKITKEYIYTYFTENELSNKCIFSNIVFGNHFGLSGKKTSKPQLCKNLGASMLIDDSLKYCQQCGPVLERVLLFDWKNEYQWSKPVKYDANTDGDLHDVIGKHKLETLPLHPNIIKVTDWKQAYDQIVTFLAQSM